MKIYHQLLMSFSIGCIAISNLANANASKIDFCVLDFMGANGDVMAMAKDYALVAQEWGVTVNPIHYANLDLAIRDFDRKKCQGLVADNFNTKKYNNFIGTLGAVGAITNYELAQRVLSSLGSDRLASKMKNNKYEVVGYIPYGLAFLHTKDRSINSIQGLQSKKLGILKVDASQERMAQKVGMQPIISTLDNVAKKFRDGEIDVLPAPLVVYKPLEIEKMLGDRGGIINYPLSLFTMNFILASGDYPKDFGQKSRQWFSRQTPQMIKTVQRWDRTVPQNIMYEIPSIDRTSYDRLLSQLRKEFIDNQTYDSSMITLIRRLRCTQDPKFIECS